jgi:hypothetical protein
MLRTEYSIVVNLEPTFFYAKNIDSEDSPVMKLRELKPVKSICNVSKKSHARQTDVDDVKSTRDIAALVMLIVHVIVSFVLFFCQTQPYA